MRQRAKVEASGLIYETVLRTPLGPMRAGCTVRGVCLLRFPEEVDQVRDWPRVGDTRVTIEREDEAFALPAARQYMQQLAEWLTAYFSRQPTAPPPLDLMACAPFRKRVLQATAQVGVGQTKSYGQIAALAGNAKASRA